MKPSAIIVDIDGTVAHSTNRGPFEYDKVIYDRPDEKIIELISVLWEAGHKLIFVTARDYVCFDDTYSWLTRHCPPFIKLHMRKKDDLRDDTIVKHEIYEKFIKSDYNVLFVLDDRNKVVDMWREIGLTCLQVAPGDF
jgi:hypothetical protein